MYRLTSSATTVQRLSDNSFIPFDGGNTERMFNECHLPTI